MFFMRLRRSAKWAFILLIFVFAFTFLFAGVGSGGGGNVISDLLGMRGGGNAIKTAEKDVAAHPKDASALNRLATAYIGQNRRGDAIKTYEKYLRLKPNDPSGYSQLGSLQDQIVTLRGNRYAALRSELAIVSGPLSSDPLATLAGSDSLLTSYTTALTTKLSNAYGSYATATQALESTYKSYVKVVPKTDAIQRAQAELQLAQAAQYAGDYTTAIKSYKSYLRLMPKSPLTAQVKKVLAELQKTSSSS